jgi:hypothetical protein
MHHEHNIKIQTRPAYEKRKFAYVRHENTYTLRERGSAVPNKETIITEEPGLHI